MTADPTPECVEAFRAWTGEAPLPRQHVDAFRAGWEAAGQPPARVIADQRQACATPLHRLFPKPSCWQCARNGAFTRSARIALGRFSATEAPERS